MPKHDLDDPTQFARFALDQIIAKHDPEVTREEGKDSATGALGKRGGARGGRARERNLTAEQRSEIACKAAQTRWKKNQA